MSPKNIKDIKNKETLSQQDVIMYRLIVLFFFGILGFAALCYISDTGVKSTIYSIFPVIKWIALAFLLAAIAFPWYIRKYRNIDERRKIVTSIGISAVVISLCFMIMLYTTIDNVAIKYQIYFTAAIILAFIYNLYSGAFFKFSLLTAAYALILSYNYINVFNWFETLLKTVSSLLVFVLPVVIIGIIIYAKRTKLKALVIGGRTIIEFASRTFMIPAVILSTFVLASAVLMMFIGGAYVYIIASLFVLYLVFGIICTIKLI